jgi:dTDP-4-dehydrorhamnose reductase
VHVSTDFVFDGTKDGAYSESDVPNPLSVYGASKLAGEHAVTAADPRALIVRTAWVFGPGGINFPTKILDNAAQSTALRVVCDEIGSPTYTLDLAAGILHLARAQAQGVFHVAGLGWCSRDEFAREVLRLAGRSDVEVEPVPASTFPGKAARPANSVLDCAKARASGVLMPEWHDSLARFVQTLP